MMNLIQEDSEYELGVLEKSICGKCFTLRLPSVNCDVNVVSLRGDHKRKRSNKVKYECENCGFVQCYDGFQVNKKRRIDENRTKRVKPVIASPMMAEKNRRGKVIERGHARGNTRANRGGAKVSGKGITERETMKGTQQRGTAKRGRGVNRKQEARRAALNKQKNAKSSALDISQFLSPFQ